MKKMIVAMILMCIPFQAFALDRPTTAEAKKVMDYYNLGSGNGAILVDYTLCQEMGKDDENKNDCNLSLSGGDIQVGDEIYLWMNYMIPVNDTAQILISYSRNNRIRKTQQISLSSAFRFRTWKKIATDKPGEWTIHISQELSDQDIDIATITYTVKD